MLVEVVERTLTAMLAADITVYSSLVGLDEEGTLARVRAARTRSLPFLRRPIRAARTCQPVAAVSSLTTAPSGRSSRARIAALFDWRGRQCERRGSRDPALCLPTGCRFRV
jgi:hypothetical protein